MDRRTKRRRRYRPRQTNAKFYGVRTASLLALGFKDYGEYLASRLWRDVRRALMAERGWECQLCGDEATQVHHQSYTVQDLTGETFDNLVAICVACHKQVEFVTEGKKRSGPGAVDKCRRMLKAARKRNKP